MYALFNMQQGSQHTALGYEAGKNMQGAHTGNTFVGMRSGLSSYGDYNTAVGINSLYNASSGSYNAILGVNAGYDISSGNKNAFLGPYAGQNNTTGYENTAVGYNAMGDGVTTGSANIAIGPENALISSGVGNIVMGYSALGAGGTTTGHRNICIGDATGYEITSCLLYTSPSPRD